VKRSIPIIIVALVAFALGWGSNEMYHFVNGMKQDVYVPDSVLENKFNNLTSQNLQYRCVVLPNSSTIQLGEEYIADVRLAAVNPKHPPVVILGHIDSTDNFIPSGDTLKYDPEVQASVFREKPKKLGKHVWEGKVLNMRDTTSNYYFHMEYTVINNNTGNKLINANR